jgi:hypothetical protein
LRRWPQRPGWRPRRSVGLPWQPYWRRSRRPQPSAGYRVP